MGPTELLTDPHHVRQDLRLMEQAVKRSTKDPEIPIPEAVIDAMPKIAGTILIKGSPREQLRAGDLLLKFMEYNRSLNPPTHTYLHAHQHIGETPEPHDRRQAITARIARLRGE